MKDGLSTSHPTPVTAEFAEKYSRMADEELLVLARDKQDLLEAACLALEEEMRRRGLAEAPEPTSSPEPSSSEAAVAPGLWKGWKTAFQAQEDAPPPKGLLAKTGKLHAFYLDTLRLYRDHFRLFATFAVPAALLNYAIWLARWFANRALARALAPDTFGPWLPTPGFLAAATAVSLTTAVSVWTVTCLAFAGIVVAVNRLAQGQEVRARDCCRDLKARWGPLLRAVLLVGFLVGLGFGAANGVTVAFLWATRNLRHGMLLSTGALWVMLALVFAVWTRVAFTIPVVMVEHAGAYTALKRSSNLGDHFLLRIWLALMESEVATYLVVVGIYKVQNYLAEQFPFPFWSRYPLGAGTTLLAGLLQVPMMIAITLLYLRARERAALLR